MPKYCPSFEYPKGTGITIRQKRNQKGNKVFGYSYTVNIPKRITYASRVRKQFKTLLEAKEYARFSIKGQKRLGEFFYKINLSDLAELAFSKKTEPKFISKRTLSDVVDEICLIKKRLFEEGTIRQRTEKSFRIQCNRIKSDLGKTSVKVLYPNIVKEWIHAMNGSRRTKENYLNTLREILNFAVSREYIDKSPLSCLTRMDIKELLGVVIFKEPEILSIKEAQALIKAAKENPKLRLLPSITLGLFCGIRTEELKRLKWCSVNLKEGYVTIDAAIAKKRRIRNVTIPPNAIKILKGCCACEPYIAPNKYCSEFEKKLKKLRVIAGICWSNNVMRHSFGSYHFAHYGDSIRTGLEMGHRNGDDVLFNHYRRLVSKEEAIRYFQII